MLLSDIQATVFAALAEDLGGDTQLNHDITATLIPSSELGHAQLICREQAVICGKAWFNESLLLVDAQLDIQWLVRDGDSVQPGTIICHIYGCLRTILTAERTALNFLQTLCATATTTHQYLQRLEGTKTKLLDTRKTIPGLRHAQKYAVRCAGGNNHRFGLWDAYLIKENHIRAYGSISEVIKQAKKQHHQVKTEIEVETLAEFKEALTTNVDIIMLDNFDIPKISEAIDYNQRQKLLEISGNISLETIRDYALTGIDFISVGALTKHVQAIDLSLIMT